MSRPEGSTSTPQEGKPKPAGKDEEFIQVIADMVRNAEQLHDPKVWEESKANIQRLFRLANPPWWDLKTRILLYMMNRGMSMPYRIEEKDEKNAQNMVESLAKSGVFTESRIAEGKERLVRMFTQKAAVDRAAYQARVPKTLYRIVLAVGPAVWVVMRCGELIQDWPSSAFWARLGTLLLLPVFMSVLVFLTLDLGPARPSIMRLLYKTTVALLVVIGLPTVVVLMHSQRLALDTAYLEGLALGAELFIVFLLSVMITGYLFRPYDDFVSRWRLSWTFQAAFIVKCRDVLDSLRSGRSVEPGLGTMDTKIEELAKLIQEGLPASIERGSTSEVKHLVRGRARAISSAIRGWNSVLLYGGKEGIYKCEVLIKKAAAFSLDGSYDRIINLTESLAPRRRIDLIPAIGVLLRASAPLIIVILLDRLNLVTDADLAKNLYLATIIFASIRIMISMDPQFAETIRSVKDSALIGPDDKK